MKVATMLRNQPFGVGALRFIWLRLAVRSIRSGRLEASLRKGGVPFGS